MALRITQDLLYSRLSQGDKRIYSLRRHVTLYPSTTSSGKVEWLLNTYMTSRGCCMVTDGFGLIPMSNHAILPSFSPETRTLSFIG